VTEKAITDAPDYAVAIPGSDGTSLITALTKLPPANFITDPQKDLLESVGRRYWLVTQRAASDC
jgi:hypothetical protein